MIDSFGNIDIKIMFLNLLCTVSLTSTTYEESCPDNPIKTVSRPLGFYWNMSGDFYEHFHC